VRGEHHGGCGTSFVGTSGLGFPAVPVNGVWRTGTCLGENGGGHRLAQACGRAWRGASSIREWERQSLAGGPSWAHGFEWS
jgi:hypothetical protein